MDFPDFDADVQRLRVDPSAWTATRARWLKLIVESLYGGMPDAGSFARAHLLHRGPSAAYGTGILESWKVSALDGLIAISMQRLIPQDTARFVTVVTGDQCWGAPDDTVRAEAMRRGVGLVWFNRVEIADDIPIDFGGGAPSREGAIYALQPAASFGAIAAWSWGYSRVIDALTEIDPKNADRIAVTGHSRGGKAALLAGATDDRIWLTHANNSGAAGAANRRDADAASESLPQLVRAFPHWLSTTWIERAHAIDALPFDQSLLLSTIAPRHLFITQAGKDARANPAGTARAIAAAGVVYAALAPHALPPQLEMRDGGHGLRHEDWFALLRRIDQLGGAR